LPQRGDRRPARLRPADRRAEARGHPQGLDRRGTDMSIADIPGVGSLPVLLAYHINLLCDRHEAAWLAGRRPRIEDVLTLEEAPGRTVLLRELLAAELAAGRQGDEEPDSGEYRARFPGDAALIEAVFAEAAPPPPRPATTGRRRPEDETGPRDQ